MTSFPLYIHIPFCLSKCTYCDFFSIACGKIKTQKSSVPDEYVTALIDDAREKVTEFNIGSWKSIYVGGGTPSLLSSSQIERLFSAIYSFCKPCKDAEITFEANPDDITTNLLSILAEVGVNRLSVGIQSFDDKVLSVIGRRANAKQNRKALLCIKKNWLSQNSLTKNTAMTPKFRFTGDLIAGLPYQTDKLFLDGILELISYEPDHISLYSLMLEESTPLTKDVNAGTVPYDLDAADEQWLLGRDILIENGYMQYEVSNFCKPNCESKHNLVYWNQEDYIGIGAGGTGTVTISGTQKAFRWTGIRDINRYCNVDELRAKKIESEIINESERRVEFLMMGFRTLQGVNSLEYTNRFGSTLEKDIGTTFERWQKRNLTHKHSVKISKNTDIEFWALNTNGILWLNQFLQEIS